MELLKEVAQSHSIDTSHREFNCNPFICPFFYPLSVYLSLCLIIFLSVTLQNINSQNVASQNVNSQNTNFITLLELVIT